MKSTLTLFLLGDAHEPVYDLRKRNRREDIRKNLNCFIAKNFYIIVLAILLLCFITFVVSCFLFIGISATESGMLRNFVNGGYV